MPIVPLVSQQDKIADTHMKPLVDIILVGRQSPGIEAPSASFDVNQFRIGGVAEVLNDDLPFHRIDDRAVQLSLVIIGIYGGDKDRCHACFSGIANELLIVASAFANTELSLEGRERLLLAVLRGLALQATKESDPWKT
jgi:hypothetical protein